MMLGLRLSEGVRAERFETRFGAELMDVLGEELTDLRQLACSLAMGRQLG